MARLAARRNRRAVGIQGNPIPGTVEFTTFSVLVGSVLQVQITQAVSVTNTTDPSQLANWLLTYWNTPASMLVSEAPSSLVGVDGAIELTFSDLGNWDTTRLWALTWKEQQTNVRGYLGERLTTTAIGVPAGDQGPINALFAMNPGGISPSTDWSSQPRITNTIVDPGASILLVFDVSVTLPVGLPNLQLSNGQQLTSAAIGSNPNEVQLTFVNNAVPGDILTIPPLCGIVSSTNNYPVAPGAFRL